jgi:hypothetical protein
MSLQTGMNLEEGQGRGGGEERGTEQMGATGEN